MKLCVTSDIITRRPDETDCTFPEVLDFLKNAGFEEIDFSFDTPMMLQDGAGALFRTKMMQAKDAGVRIRYAHLPFDYPAPNRTYNWDEFLSASKKAIDLAVEAGVDCAAIHPCTAMTRDFDPVREHENAVAFLRPYCRYAKEAGLTLALENMRGPGQSAPKEIKRYATETADLIRVADELCVGICWDTGHANISAQPQCASLLSIGNRLRMLHVNDNFAEDDVHVAPFIGNVDWNGIAEGLRQLGFAGSINLEVSCCHLPHELQAPHAAYMAAAAKKLGSMLK